MPRLGLKNDISPSLKISSVNFRQLQCSIFHNRQDIIGI